MSTFEITPEKVAFIREMRAKGHTLTDIAKMSGTVHSHVHRICNDYRYGPPVKAQAEALKFDGSPKRPAKTPGPERREKYADPVLASLDGIVVMRANGRSAKLIKTATDTEAGGHTVYTLTIRVKDLDAIG